MITLSSSHPVITKAEKQNAAHTHTQNHMTHRDRRVMLDDDKYVESRATVQTSKAFHHIKIIKKCFFKFCFDQVCSLDDLTHMTLFFFQLDFSFLELTHPNFFSAEK